MAVYQVDLLLHNIDQLYKDIPLCKRITFRLDLNSLVIVKCSLANPVDYASFTLMFVWTFSCAESRPMCSLERCGSFPVCSRCVSLKPLKVFLWMFPDNQDHPKSTWGFLGYRHKFSCRVSVHFELAQPQECACYCQWQFDGDGVFCLSILFDIVIISVGVERVR